MTLFNTLKHIIRHYMGVLLHAFPKKIPKEVQVFRSDCEKLVERYNTLLKEISEYSSYPDCLILSAKFLASWETLSDIALIPSGP